MNAGSVLSFLSKNKIVRISKNEIVNICNEIGSDVLLGMDRKTQ